MDCPKRSEMVLHGKITRRYPEFLKLDKEGLDIDTRYVDHSSLLEPDLFYNSGDTADIVIMNARVYDKGDVVQNIAITDNIITKIGDPSEIEPLIGDATQIIDAEGNSVLPGFTDSHLHLAVAMQKLNACDVEDVKTSDQFINRLAEYAKQKSDEPVLYVFGLHYFDNPIIPAENCRMFLDGIVGDKPVLVYAHDMHTAWANTAALKIADLFRAMPPYPHLIEELGLDDKIVLGTDQIPSGEFREPEVYYFLSEPLHANFPRAVDQQLADLKAVCNQLASLGITGVHRMALAQPAEDISFLLLVLELEQRGELPVRISTSFSSIADSNMLDDVYLAYLVRNALARARRKEINATELHDYLVGLMKNTSEARHNNFKKISKPGSSAAEHPHAEKIDKSLSHIKSTTHDKHIQPHLDRGNPHHHESLPEHINYHAKVRCDTVKIFMDGVIEKNTAYRTDQAPTEGIPEFSQDELDALLELADRLGMQVAAHAIGNASVKSMLDAIANAREKNKEIDAIRGHYIPHRIEHIETCRHEDIPRFREQHVVTSMQPLHERAPMTMWHELVPKEEWDTAFPWKDLLQHGAVLVFGSDWPIVSCDVRKGVNHAVTREPWFADGKEQKLTLDEALSAYTDAAAFTEYCSGIKGKIRAGMLADIVMLSGKVDELLKPSPKSIFV